MGVRAAAEYTRPADATPYAAKDVIADNTDASLATYLTFKSLGAAGDMPDSMLQITEAKLLTSQTTNTARFRLHLYRTAPVALADNAPYTGPLYATRATYIGAVEFAACQVEGTGATAAYSINQDIGLSFVKDDLTSHLYGILETLDIFTPASAQTFYIEMTCVGEVH